MPKIFPFLVVEEDYSRRNRHLYLEQAQKPAPLLQQLN